MGLAYSLCKIRLVLALSCCCDLLLFLPRTIKEPAAKAATQLQVFIDQAVAMSMCPAASKATEVCCCLLCCCCFMRAVLRCLVPNGRLDHGYACCRNDKLK
jgi:hypothetical protein